MSCMTFNPGVSLGFKRFCTVEDVAEAYPLLDMVNHDNRRKIVSVFVCLVKEISREMLNYSLKN